MHYIKPRAHTNNNIKIYAHDIYLASKLNHHFILYLGVGTSGPISIKELLHRIGTVKATRYVTHPLKFCKWKFGENFHKRIYAAIIIITLKQIYIYISPEKKLLSDKE